MYSAFSCANFALLQVQLLKRLEDLGVVVVAAAHNDYRTQGDRLDDWPTRWSNPDFGTERQLKNLIIVGGIDKNSEIMYSSPFNAFVTLMAPGRDLSVATFGYTTSYKQSGNSLGR